MSEDDSKTFYETCVDNINQAPLTYLPALLSIILKRCVKEQVFKNGRAMAEFITKQVVAESSAKKG